MRTMSPGCVNLKAEETPEARLAMLSNGRASEPSAWEPSGVALSTKIIFPSTFTPTELALNTTARSFLNVTLLPDDVAIVGLLKPIGPAMADARAAATSDFVEPSPKFTGMLPEETPPGISVRLNSNRLVRPE